MTKERKFKTEANQKVIKVNKVKVNKGTTYTVIDNNVLFNAIQELKHNELKVFLYMASNQDGFEFALSTKHVAEVTGANQRKIQEAINTLIEKGYLIQAGENSNVYMFYEDNTMYKKDIADLDSVQKVQDDVYQKDIGVCTKSTEGGVQKVHSPMYKKDIEIIQDNTNNNTIYNTNIDCNALPVSKEQEQVDMLYPTNVEPTKEETRAIDNLNSNSFTLSDLIEEFKKETGATVRKTTIANKTKDLQSRNDIDLDIVRELFKKHLNKNSTSDKSINVIFAGMLKYANDNYDKAVEEDRVYKRKQEQEQARTEREIARMNDDYCYEPEPELEEITLTDGRKAIVRKNNMTGNFDVVEYIA